MKKKQLLNAGLSYKRFKLGSMVSFLNPDTKDGLKTFRCGDIFIAKDGQPVFFIGCDTSTPPPYLTKDHLIELLDEMKYREEYGEERQFWEK